METGTIRKQLAFLGQSNQLFKQALKTRNGEKKSEREREKNKNRLTGEVP